LKKHQEIAPRDHEQLVQGHLNRWPQHQRKNQRRHVEVGFFRQIAQPAAGDHDEDIGEIEVGAEGPDEAGR